MLQKNVNRRFLVFICKNRHSAALCSNGKKEENSSLTSVANFQGSSKVLLQTAKV